MRCYFYVLKSDRIGNRVFSLRESGYLSLHISIYIYLQLNQKKSDVMSHKITVVSLCGGDRGF